MSNASIQIASLREYVEEFLDGKGPFTLRDPDTALGFLKSSLEKIHNYPDIELIMMAPNASLRDGQRVFNWDQDIYNAVFGDTNRATSFLITVINLHQRSVGSVRLNTSSPYDFPLIDDNYLSDPENHDINVIYEGVQFVLQLIQTEPFQRIGASFQVKPIKQCSQYQTWSRDYWYCFIRYMTYDVYHPVGTCPMGPDPKNGSVVNNKLQVYGMKNLRVADASVFPLTLSGHPNAPCVMVGEVGSDMIKRFYNISL